LILAGKEWIARSHSSRSLRDGAVEGSALGDVEVLVCDRVLLLLQILALALALCAACDDAPSKSDVFDASELVDSSCDAVKSCTAGLVCLEGACVSACSRGLVPCAGHCVDVRNDQDHCGACDSPCESGFLCDGAGRCDLSCQAGLIECAGRCVDPGVDRQNCGGCGTTCGPGLVCDGIGACQLSCQASLINCGGRCTDTFLDRFNCGECGSVCSIGELCFAENCSVSCPAGLTICDGRCADLRLDRDHCGECNRSCVVGEVCDGSATCALSCQTGFEQCGVQCVDPQIDRRHCGGCAQSCGSGEVCVEGACLVSCQVGLQDCDGWCVDLQGDRRHCGGCGSACDSGEVCDGAAQCALTCQTGLEECDGVCVNTRRDARNCGRCGLRCKPGEQCDGFGACARNCAEDRIACEEGCIDPLSDELHCGATARCADPGRKCSESEQCLDGLCQLVCPNGQEPCEEACKDLRVDSVNCGTCGVVCPPGQLCNGTGVCAPTCQDDFTECSGACRALSSDPMNCGTCRAMCATQHGTAFCNSGNCGIACDSGWLDCDSTQPGCETSASTDMNCGRCNKACVSGKQACVNQLCTCLTSCTANTRRCSTSLDSVEECLLDTVSGCTNWASAVSTPAVCGDHQSCGGGSTAHCQCETTFCPAVGSFCMDTTTRVTCELDADGCLYPAAQTVCPGGQTCSAAHCGCNTGAECPVGTNCDAITRLCTVDLNAPRIVAAFLRRPVVVRVQFSEAMRAGNGLEGVERLASYCIEPFDGDPSVCTASSEFVVLAVTPVDEMTVDLWLSSVPTAPRYTLVVSEVVDAAGNPLSVPSYADFDTGGDLEIVDMVSTGPSSFEVSFNRALWNDVDGPGSAACSTPAECAKRYRLVGPTDLGAIASASIRPFPNDHIVDLVHTLPQEGRVYTVVGANGRDGDGFDDVTWGAIGSADQTRALAPSPKDREWGFGEGTLASAFGDGPLGWNIFADQQNTPQISVTTEGFLFLGVGNHGRGALRLDTSSRTADGLTFRLPSDTNAIGTTTKNGSPSPFASIGFSTCTAGTPACGPDNERGYSLFGHSRLDGADLVFLSGTETKAYAYVSTDTDDVLDFDYVDLSLLFGSATRSVTSIVDLNEVAYLGAMDGGTGRPILIGLNARPLLLSSGLDPTPNGGSLCEPAVHEACLLGVEYIPTIGGAGTPRNNANPLSVDLFAHHGLLYFSNNGGIVRSTTATPADYAHVPSDWTLITPTAPELTGTTRAPLTEYDVHPRDKGWPFLVEHKGDLYAARNTLTGPQLWRCQPDLVSSPFPASPTACDAGDWTFVAGNSSGTLDQTQLNNPNNTAISLLQSSGGFLYLGFANATDGVSLYRSAAAPALRMSDFEGLGGCVGGTANCVGLGGNGLGNPTVNTEFYTAVTLNRPSGDELYVIAGGPGQQSSLYRQTD